MNIILAIFRREVAAFFDSLIAYIVYSVFLVGVGMFFWVVAGNVLENQSASLDILFVTGPWLFLFLIPAITMRSFAEEFKTGTIELLATKPITEWQILTGKYLAAVFLVFVSLLPTLIYYFSVRALGDPPGNIDTGATWGAYLGLLGIGATFCAIGIFSSALTSNQIVAFILATVLCFSQYVLFDYLADLAVFSTIRDVIVQLGMAEHYRSISRGVVDSRDAIYYVGIITFYLFLGKTILSVRKK